MSSPLKSRNHFNFSAPNKCRSLFKPIILEYSCKQSITWLMHSPRYNLKVKQLLVNNFNMIMDNQDRLVLNDQSITSPHNEPQRSPEFVQKQPLEVLCQKQIKNHFHLIFFVSLLQHQQISTYLIYFRLFSLINCKCRSSANSPLFLCVFVIFLRVLNEYFF